MQDSCMIALPDDLPDMGKRTVGVLLRQIHRNLTRLYDFPLARVGLDSSQLQVIVFTDYILNRFDRHLFLFQLYDTAHHLFGQRQVDHPVERCRIGQQGGYDTFHVAYVLRHVACNKIEHIVRDHHSIMTDLILQDLLTQIQIRALQFCRQPPFQAGEQTFLHPVQVYRSLIGSHDQLLT